MAKITMDTYEEIGTLPENSIIHTTIQSCEVKTVTSTRGDWQKLEFTFNIDGIQVVGDGTPIEAYSSLIGQRIWGSVPFKLNDGAENRLKQWVEAIIGMELTSGFELDTDLLEHKRVRAVTTTYDKKTVDPRTGQPFKQHQVQALLPMGAGAPASTPDPWATQTPAAGAAAGSDVWGAKAPVNFTDEPPF